ASSALRNRAASRYPRPARDRSTGSLQPWLFIHQPQGAGEQPGEPLAQAIAPVLPVVPVAGLDVAHLHADVLEERDQRAVLVDERFVHPAGPEQLFGDGAPLLPELVHERHDRVEQGPAVVALADVGERERARLEEEAAVEAGVAERGGQAGDAAEARPHEAPPGGLA